MLQAGEFAYSVGRKWFSRDVSFPRRYRGHRQEQGLASGRPITEKEARALPMDEVIENLEEILDSCDQIAGENL